MAYANKVIVIGLDGADKDLLWRWSDAGLLPNVRTLFDRATRCVVDNPPGLFAGAVCPSFYTGVSPARHGKFCSHQMMSGTYDFRRVQGYDLSCPNLWDVLGRQGRRVAVIDAPKSSVSESINGVQIVDWAAEDFDIELGAWPKELVEEIVEKYGRNEVVELAVAARGFEGLATLGSTLRARLRNKLRMSRDVLAREDWNFFFSLFTEVHTAGHLAWHLHDSQHPRYDATQAERIGDIVREIYVATDEAIGEFMAMADDDTSVWIYSNNGMGASHTANHLLDNILFQIDRRRLSPVRRELTRAADWIERRTPGAVHDTFQPVQRALRRSLGLALRDPASRTAFRVPSNTVSGGVRINLAGREPSGLVELNDYASVCADLSRILGGLRDGPGGEPLVKRVIRTHETYSGKHLEELPDLLVEWTQAAAVNNVWSPETGNVQGVYGGHRTGDHRPEGVLFMLGPGEGRGEVGRLSVYDLAPTIAGMMGACFPGSDGQDRSTRLQDT